MFDHPEFLIMTFTILARKSVSYLVVSSLYQMTPLHVAAERGFVKIVDYLVGKGADIEIQDKNGVIVIVPNNVVLFNI